MRFVTALAGEPELAVVAFVMEQVGQGAEHLPAVSADQNVRTRA